MTNNQPNISTQALAVEVVDSRSILSAMLDHYCETMSELTNESADSIRQAVFARANQYKPIVVDLLTKDTQNNSH